MEDYIGKYCPYCKEEIRSGDGVKVCKSCGVPHHTKCWVENKGCTTFGCTDEYVEETADTLQNDKNAELCIRCGAFLDEGQDFCPKCGTPRGGMKKPICQKCGADLQDGQDFCSRCGQKVGEPTAVVSPDAVNNEPKKKKTGKTIAIVLVILIVLAGLAALVWFYLFPTFFPNLLNGSQSNSAQSNTSQTDDVSTVVSHEPTVVELCAEGKYSEAFTKADSSYERKKVKAESVAAERSAFAADNLKDPSSFKLRDVYYREDLSASKPKAQVVLQVNGANSFGASVSNYMVFVWDEDKGNWTYFGSVSDLVDDEVKSYDSDSRRIEKATDNLIRSLIRDIRDEGLTLEKDAVKRINHLFEIDELDKVVAISISRT